MIKKIHSLKNFGVYKNYNGTLIPEFKEKNILYGWNYSGKTTLSRLFSSIKNKTLNSCFSDSEFKIILDDNSEITQENIDSNLLKILVFNSDYIKENLKWDTNSEIDGITFDVGEAIGVREKIEKLEKKITLINGNEEIKSKKSQYFETINEFEDFENYKFTDEARSIKNDIFNSLIEFNKGHFKTITKSIISDLESYIISDKVELNRIKKLSLSTNDKSPILPVHYDIEFRDLYQKVMEICLEEPPKKNILQILEDNSDASNWVKQGINIHKTKKDCLFCGNQITQERIEKLKLYFGNESSILRENIENLIDEIDEKINEFENIEYPITKLEFYDNFQEDYQKLFDEYPLVSNSVRSYLKSLKNELTNKIGSRIHIKQRIFEYDNSAQEEIKNWIKETNNLIEKNNEIYLNFDKYQDNARTVLKKHQIAKFLKDESYKEKETKYNYAQSCIKRYDCYIKKAKLEIEKLESQLKSIVKGKTELNNFIQKFLNREDIRIEIVNDDKFILKRKDKIAENLSEGEKTAISFSYFLVTLESLLQENKIFDYIIFIDDPISSLDGNHISQVYSLINSFFFRKGLNPNNLDENINCFKQLFISTHNFEFFTFIKDSSRINKKNTKQYYFVKRISNDCSEIIELPNSLKNYKSEYLYLFNIIYKFYEDGCNETDEKFILMPNAIRRFLEIYTLMKLPGSNEEVDGRLKILMSEPNELKMLHHFSHFTTLEKIARHDEILLNLKTATEELMKFLKKDTVHYESLEKAVDK